MYISNWEPLKFYLIHTKMSMNNIKGGVFGFARAQNNEVNISDGLLYFNVILLPGYYFDYWVGLKREFPI